MRERLEMILAQNENTITGAIISEILEEQNPIEALLYFQEYGVEGGIVKCLEFEKDCEKFFNRHYKEIEEMKQEFGAPLIVKQGYTTKMFFSNWAFKTRALDLYMFLTLEE